MYLSQLTLSEFRNYKQLDLALGAGLFVFYGDNAQGKTNLLEAVSMLATATSFHASSDREVVNWSAPEHVARLLGTAERDEGEVQVEITFYDPTPPDVQAEGLPSRHNVEMPANTPRKRYKLNGAPRRTMDVIGQMKVVVFSPTDLHLVDGSPEERRRFLDRSLCQVQPRYCQSLVRYRKVVTQRSALLKRVRDNEEDPRMLDYLDEQLTSLANQIIFERQRMVEALKQQAQHYQNIISGGNEQLDIVYRPSLHVDPAWSTVEAQQHYLEQLKAARRKELIQGVCLLGPHRDDLEFVVNGMNIQTYGSRGQQRTVALAVKLAELAYMKTSTGDEPILLLDDVFSELDHQRREHLLQQVLQHTQVLLTANDLSVFPTEITERAHVYHVVNGTLHKETSAP
ncbi:MAG TPA: DNA replication/repair protein RecF [Ktedonobacteraceae bacterium]|jgi:DNA replication and repair protein RecF|nr:DNA replication/repair protein RecF [Ktedonobacteraceae bacterium]